MLLSRYSSASPRYARLLALTAALALVPGVACGPPPKPPPPPMDRFDPGLCPKLPPEDTSRPVDPNLEGVKADLAVPQVTGDRDGHTLARRELHARPPPGHQDVITDIFAFILAYKI